MRINAQQQMSSEHLGLKIRCVLLIGVAFIGSSKFGEAWFASGFGILAASVVLGWHVCSEPNLYLKFGQKFMTAMRLLDVIALTTLSFEGPFLRDNLWLLTIPAILSEGLISRNIR